MASAIAAAVDVGSTQEYLEYFALNTWMEKRNHSAKFIVSSLISLHGIAGAQTMNVNLNTLIQFSIVPLSFFLPTNIYNIFVLFVYKIVFMKKGFSFSKVICLNFDVHE